MCWLVAEVTFLSYLSVSKPTHRLSKPLGKPLGLGKLGDHPLDTRGRGLPAGDERRLEKMHEHCLCIWRKS